MNTPTSGNKDSDLQVPKPGMRAKILNSQLGGRVLAGIIVSIISSFGVGTWFGNALARQSRSIKLVEDGPTPGAEPGWQDVTLAVEPPPSAGENVQVWIRQGNFNWYPCRKATQLADGRNWKATCIFGNPDSKEPNDWAKPGEGAFAYGVFCSRDLTSFDIRGKDVPDRDISWQAQLLKVAQVEPKVLAAVYKGRLHATLKKP